MEDKHTFRDRLHAATHRVPGIPAHVNQQAGHQGTVRHGNAPRNPAARNRNQNRNQNHTQARPPRVLVAWQNRIAAFFGQELG